MPLIAKCRQIQGVMLPKASKQLATHFKKLEIEPQIYALCVVRFAHSPYSQQVMSDVFVSCCASSFW